MGMLNGESVKLPGQLAQHLLEIPEEANGGREGGRERERKTDRQTEGDK